MIRHLIAVARRIPAVLSDAGALQRETERAEDWRDRYRQAKGRLADTTGEIEALEDECQRLRCDVRRLLERTEELHRDREDIEELRDRERARADAAEEAAEYHLGHIMAAEQDCEKQSDRADAAEKRVCELDEQIQDWQCASGLIGSCGDPSTVRPKDLENRIAEDEKRVRELEAELAKAWREWPPDGPKRVVFCLRFVERTVREFKHYSDERITILPQEVLYRELTSEEQEELQKEPGDG